MPESPLPPISSNAGSRRVRELPSPPRAAAPPPLPPQLTITDAGEPGGWWANQGRVESSAWLVSFVVHAVVLFIFGIITLDVRSGGTAVRFLASVGADADVPAPRVEQPPLLIKPSVREGDSPKNTPLDTASLDKPLDKPSVVFSNTKPGKIDTGSPTKAGTAVPSVKAAKASQAPTGGGWEGRDPAARAGLAGRGGGTRQSEDAVERGLRWLVAHQSDDGGWRFDLNRLPCNGMCRNSGTESSVTAATGLALLPFLGAGYTHQVEGEYQETVRRGLYYLSTKAMVTAHGVDLRGGGDKGMYGQGIATLALCEAYGMTRDESLKELAQGAVRFIVYAQDLRTGGWRYTPGTPGDTTVTGWQLMVLKSAQMARLDVPSPALGLVTKFLDSVQFDSGARYGYLLPIPRAEKQEATTAVGLLCRMYTGWHRDNPALYQGVAFLHKWGPSDTNLYYDYYATQVLHHFGGPEWQAWNPRMRDYLVARQSRNSHESGSWYFADGYGDAGGRLYNTAMALMILEVYYRHMPLYGQEAVSRGI